MFIYRTTVVNRNMRLDSIDTPDGGEHYPVNGNNGDLVVVTVDSEWFDANIRGLFIWNGKYYIVDQNAVDGSAYTFVAPSLYNTNFFRFGIYAGEHPDDSKYLSTTPIELPCQLSIRDFATRAHDDYGENYTDEAKKAAEDAANSAFDANYHAERAVAFDVSAKVHATEAAQSATEAAVAYSKFSNALKGSVSGEAVTISDVSPLEHEMSVRISSKNLIPYPYRDSTLTRNGITFTDNGDGSVTLNGTATERTFWYFMNTPTAMFQQGTTYTLSGLPTMEGVILRFECYKDGVYRQGISSTKDGATITLNDENNKFTLFARVDSGVTVENLTVYPQLEKGTTATAYTPYIEDVSAVTLTREGENTDATTYTVNTDGTVSGVSSLYPYTTLMTDTPGALIECEYNRDINKAFEEITQAIISMGGNV